MDLLSLSSLKVSISTFYALNKSKGKKYTLIHFRDAIRNHLIRRIKEYSKKIDTNLIHLIRKMCQNLKRKIHYANEHDLLSLNWSVIVDLNQ